MSSANIYDAAMNLNYVMDSYQCFALVHINSTFQGTTKGNMLLIMTILSLNHDKMEHDDVKNSVEM